MPFFKYGFLLLLALLTASCSMNMPNVVYKLDVQQGNVLTQEMVSKLKPGMTKSQVRFILGTPLINDVFHADRWDYVYRMEKAGKLAEERHMTVIFEQDVLKRLEGDVVAAAAPADKLESAPSENKPEPVAKDKVSPAAGAEKKEEKGFFGRMLEKIGL